MRATGRVPGHPIFQTNPAEKGLFWRFFKPFINKYSRDIIFDEREIFLMGNRVDVQAKKITT